MIDRAERLVLTEVCDGRNAILVSHLQLRAQNDWDGKSSLVGTNMLRDRLLRIKGILGFLVEPCLLKFLGYPGPMLHAHSDLGKGFMEKRHRHGCGRFGQSTYVDMTPQHRCRIPGQIATKTWKPLHREETCVNTTTKCVEEIWVKFLYQHDMDTGVGSMTIWISLLQFSTKVSNDICN